MANEAVIVKGTYASLIAAEEELNGAFCTASGALSGTITDTGEQTYPLLDFQFKVSVGTPDENGTVDLYRIPSDGTDDAPTPAGSYLQQYVGSFTLDNAGTTDYYLYGVTNVDANDKFIWENNCGQTITGQLLVRARTTGPAA